MFRCGDPIDSTCLWLASAHAFAALSQSGDRYQLCLTTADVSLQIGLSVKHSYWLKLTSLGISSSRSDSGHAGLSRSTKYVRHAVREILKNATRKSAIYRFCFTKFMPEMLRSLSNKVVKCSK